MSDNWDKIEELPDAGSVIYDMYMKEKARREKAEKELVELNERFSKFGKDICEATGCLYDSRDPIKLAAENLDDLISAEAELKRYREKYGPLD